MDPEKSENQKIKSSRNVISALERTVDILRTKRAPSPGKLLSECQLNGSLPGLLDGIGLCEDALRRIHPR